MLLDIMVMSINMFKKIFSTTTWKQSQITIVSTLVNGGLGAFFYITMARFLGPADFGLLVVSIATLTLIADIADLGTNTGLIRFVSSHLISDKTKAFRFLKLGLKIKVIVWMLVLIAGFFLAPILANLVFKKETLLLPLRMVMVGVGGALLFTYATSSLQSFQKYFSWSFVNISSNLLRLFLIFVLFYSQNLNLINGLIVYIALPFLGFSLSLLFLPTKQILSVKGENEVANQFFKFNRWVAVFTIIAAISSRLDTFLNARLLNVQEVGIYGSANQLIQVVPQIIGALGVVAAPKFASFKNKTDMFKYFKKFQLMVLGVSLLLILTIPLSFYVIPFLYGTSYTEAVIPFIILLLAMVVFLLSVPLHNAIIFYYGRSDIFVWISIVHFLIIGLVGVFMITNYGIVGTSLTVFIGMIANFLLPLVWFLFKIRE